MCPWVLVQLQMALSFFFPLVNDCNSVCVPCTHITHTQTHVLVFCVSVFYRFFFFPVLCVDTIPAFMRLPEPICVPVGAILARRRPPLGTIWALLKAVSSPPPLSSPRCYQTYLFKKGELTQMSCEHMCKKS